MTFSENDLHSIFKYLSEEDVFSSFQDVVYRYSHTFDSSDNLINISILQIFDVYAQALLKEDEDASWVFFSEQLQQKINDTEITLDFIPLTDDPVIDEFKTNLSNQKDYVDVYDMQLSDTYNYLASQLEKQLDTMRTGQRKNDIIDTYYQGRAFGYRKAIELNQYLKSTTLSFFHKQVCFSEQIDNETATSFDLEIDEEGKVYENILKDENDRKLYKNVWNDFQQGSNSYKKKDDIISDRETILLKKGLLDTIQQMKCLKMYDVSSKAEYVDTYKTLYQSLVGMHEVFSYSACCRTDFVQKDKYIFNPSNEFLRASCLEGETISLVDQDWESVAANYMKYKQGRSTKELEKELRIAQEDYKKARATIDSIQAKKAHPDGDFTKRKSWRKAFADCEFAQQKINYINSELTRRSEFGFNYHINATVFDDNKVENENKSISGPTPQTPKLGASIGTMLRSEVETIFNNHKDLFNGMDVADKCAVVVYEHDKEIEVAIINSVQIAPKDNVRASCYVITKDALKETNFVDIKKTSSKPFIDQNTYDLKDEKGEVYHLKSIIVQPDSYIAHQIAAVLDPHLMQGRNDVFSMLTANTSENTQFKTR